MKNKKCKHNYLFIYRRLQVLHSTEVSVKYDEDEHYHETTIKNDWCNEWNILNYTEIEVVCSDCNKKWIGKNELDFPKWIQQVLYQEVSHFKDL